MSRIIFLLLFAFAMACGKPRTAAVVVVQPVAKIFEGRRPSDRATPSVSALRVEVMDEREQPLTGAIVRIRFLNRQQRFYRAVEVGSDGKGTIHDPFEHSEYGGDWVGEMRDFIAMEVNFSCSAASSIQGGLMKRRRG